MGEGKLKQSSNNRRNYGVTLETKAMQSWNETYRTFGTISTSDPDEIKNKRDNTHNNRKRLQCGSARRETVERIHHGNRLQIMKRIGMQLHYGN